MGAVLLIAAVAAIRRYGGNRFPWLTSISGAAVIAVLFTLLTTLSAGLAVGQALSTGLFYVSVAGTYSLAHDYYAEQRRNRNGICRQSNNRNSNRAS